MSFDAAIADSNSPKLSVLRSFVQHLDASERAELETILKELESEYPTITPLQRSMMAIATLIQMHMVGKSIKAAKSQDDLTPNEKALLEWSRRTYDSLVNQVITKERTTEKNTTFGQILDQFLREQREGDKFRVERKFEKISVEQVEAEASRRGIANRKSEEDHRAVSEGDVPLPDPKKAVDKLLGKISESNSDDYHSADEFFMV